MRTSWRSSEGRMRQGKDLKPGMLIAIDYAGYRHKPWRIIEVKELEDGRHAMIVRPVGEVNDFAQFNQSLTLRKYASLPVLPEHYSVCHCCGELPPCSEVWSAQVASASAERAVRYEVEGVCPACEEPVTRRQKAHRFEENLYVPLGPPVVFHARYKCASSAMSYDEALAKRHDRDPTLSCVGQQVRHQDGIDTCNRAGCPGPEVRHRAFARCYVLSEKCNRPECWAINEGETK